jgi:hypothetical protein
MEDDADIREQIFHNTVRENIVSERLRLYIILGFLWFDVKQQWCSLCTHNLRYLHNFCINSSFSTKAKLIFYENIIHPILTFLTRVCVQIC